MSTLTNEFKEALQHACQIGRVYLNKKGEIRLIIGEDEPAICCPITAVYYVREEEYVYLDEVLNIEELAGMDEIMISDVVWAADNQDTACPLLRAELLRLTGLEENDDN